MTSGVEVVPLLSESTAYVRRLMRACRAFGETTYQFHRRVNWSHRHEATYYQREATSFVSDPSAYLADRHLDIPRVADVYELRLNVRQVVVVLAKVALHWSFRILGRAFDRRIRDERLTTYRKCYVDDIELVFDPHERGVLRAVYPFPLSARRQWRYGMHLIRNRHRFQLAGYPYAGKDLARFAVRQDVRSLRRLEARAQLRHAAELGRLGFISAQLSDEFDICSLDFTRRLSKLSIAVVNSAHGVGKYLPVHAYPEFFVLTDRQAEYYVATRPCSYRQRTLNVRERRGVPDAGQLRRATVVYIGQTFPGTAPLINSNENRIVERLGREFAQESDVGLFYRPHPTNFSATLPSGFRRLGNLESVNGSSSTVFVSMFSTCQIDPNFKGRKILVRSDLIHPEIAFDDAEEIVDLEGLIDILRSFAAACRAHG